MTLSHEILGIDVGGANIKYATSTGQAIHQNFPLWKQKDQLTDALNETISRFPRHNIIALTMTGELADCYQSKPQGIDHIIASVIEAAPDRQIFIWQTAGEFVSPQIAREFPSLTAAANWHALATWAGRSVSLNQSALLIDIGSTTTDMIPIIDGIPQPLGLTDLERLQSCELIYAGVSRTPISSMINELTVNGMKTPLAAELFATSLDLFLLSGHIEESEDQIWTADGRAASIICARQRIARMICADAVDLSEEIIDDMASQIRDHFANQLMQALDLVLTRMESFPSLVILSGEGEFLAQKLISDHRELKQVDCLSLTNLLGEELSSCACAYSLAQLAQERVLPFLS